jgi:antitoxin component YwqK of YwqJK toxin-antitoxin module
MWISEELIFFDGSEEIARQRADPIGNLKPISGRIPDGKTEAYGESGELLGTIQFKDNLAEGPATIGNQKLSFLHGNRNGEATATLSGNRRQVILYEDGQVKLWRNYTGNGELELEHLRMEHGQNRNRYYYPNGKLRLEVLFKDGGLEKDEYLEVRKFSDAGTLLIDARKQIALDQCAIDLDKNLYLPKEAIRFSAVCSCPAPGDCLTSSMSKFWQKIVLSNADGKRFAVVSCPRADISDSYNYEPWFKDGSHVMWFSWPDSWHEFHFVEVDQKTQPCTKDIWLDAGNVLPPGQYSVSLSPPFNGKSFPFVITGAR